MASVQRDIVLPSQSGFPQKEILKPECKPIFWSRVDSEVFVLAAGMSIVYSGPAEAVAEKRTMETMLLSEKCMFSIGLLEDE